MKLIKKSISVVLLIAVTICSVVPTTAIDARVASSPESVSMHRLYNPNSGEHFYTADSNEKDNLVSLGWNYEGIGWTAPESSDTPVYRLYNPNAGDHHYTMNEGEKDNLIAVGWNYEGIGWYSDDAESVPLYRQYNPNAIAGAHNYTTSQDEDRNLVAVGWQAEGIGWYGVYSSENGEANEPLKESEKSVDNYAVINLEVNPATKSVNAKVGAPGNCKLVVRFVSEDVYFADGYYSGKEYINGGATQASCDVAAKDEFVEVTSAIDNADVLPEYYVVEAVLVDANGKNLCSPYTSIENTRRHEEFEAKDIYSFEGHNVVNFDEDSTTNFGVLEDDVKILTAEEIVEEVNEEDESKNYTITSPSENMEVGDKVYIKDDAGEYLFKVAEKNTLSDGKIFIKAARANDANYGFKLEDFFTYVDVEMEGYGEQEDEYSSNEKLNGSSSDDEDVVISNEKGASDSLPRIFGPEKIINNEYFEMEASISGDVTVDVDFEYDKYISLEPFKCDVEYTSTLDNKISAKAKTSLSKNIGRKQELEKTLGYVSIPIVLPIIDAKMEVGIELSCQLSAGFTARGTSSVDAGFHYDSVTGYVPFSQKSNTWEIINATGEVEIKVGPTASVGIEILFGVVSVELEGFIGLVADASIEANTGNDDHACTVCASGELKGCAELSLNVECFYSLMKPYEATLISAEIPLFRFYVSIKNPSGQVQSGRGDCPYKTGGSNNGGSNNGGANNDGSNNGAFAKWKNIYIESLKGKDETHTYNLVYINDDDIPELIEYYESGEEPYKMEFATIITIYSENSLSSIGSFNNVIYIPKSNLMYTYDFNGSGSSQILEIQDGKFVNIAKAQTNVGSEHYNYFNDAPMSLEECARRMAQAFGDATYTLTDGWGGKGFVLSNPNARRSGDEQKYTKEELIKVIQAL